MVLQTGLTYFVLLWHDGPQPHVFAVFVSVDLLSIVATLERLWPSASGATSMFLSIFGTCQALGTLLAGLFASFFVAGSFDLFDHSVRKCC